MARNNFNFHNPVSGSAFGENAQVYNYYADKQDAFVEITIADLELRYKKLRNIKHESLLTRLQEERLLVLGGDFGINKNDLALHLAFILAQNNQIPTSHSGENSLTIKEWNRGSLNIDRELHKAESPTIFILTEVEAKDVGFDWFIQTHKTAKELSKHYVIVSTDRSFTSWHLEEKARQFFPVSNFQDISDSDGLLQELTEQLNKYNLLSELTPYLETEGQSLQLVAQKLLTPTNITHFVELFRQEIKRLSEEVIEDKLENKPIQIDELIKIAKSDEQFIRKLYYDILNPREQLLALGLSFFNGLFEDQLFAALERVVQDVWQKRDPSLRSLDYSDLEQLQNQYFDLDQNNLYESKPDDFKVVKTKDYKIDLRSIKILSIENRQLLFKIAWESHRRQIVTALDILVDLVEESVVEKNYYGKGKWELYGDAIRRKKLRQVISETVTDIGLVSTSAFSAVEGLLLRLATNEDWLVRQVAASAIARWYPTNQQNLFRIIQKFYDIALKKESDEKQSRWREEEKTEESSQKNKKSESEKPQKPQKRLVAIINWVKDTINSTFKKKPKAEDYYTKGESELEDYIGSTVAVAIGETIHEYYGTNELSDDFYNWLEELLKSRLRLVHLHFAYHTLLYAAPLHFQDERIRQILKDLTERERYYVSPELLSSLNHGIACTLAYAYIYPQNSQQVKQTLDDWYKEGKNRRSWVDTKKITKDDTLLTTVALTYGLIPYEINPYLKVNNSLRKLAEILEEEKHPFVREAVVFAICCLTRRYFNQIASQLQDILSDFTQEEQKKLVKSMTEIYLEERVNINGNISEVEARKTQHKGKKYQVWKKPEKRPMTPIEEAMKNWAKLENKAPAQQTAIQALVAFANELK